MESKFWDSEIVFWIGMTGFFAVLAAHAVIRPRWPAKRLTEHRRDLWLNWLIERGPVPLSKMPNVAGQNFPLNKYRLAGLIEHDLTDDPLVQISGYGRVFMSDRP